MSPDHPFFAEANMRFVHDDLVAAGARLEQNDMADIMLLVAKDMKTPYMDKDVNTLNSEVHRQLMLLRHPDAGYMDDLLPEKGPAVGAMFQPQESVAHYAPQERPVVAPRVLAAVGNFS
jgi:hypothetical protein